jgi:hypothetical protein
VTRYLNHPTTVITISAGLARKVARLVPLGVIKG